MFIYVAVTKNLNYLSGLSNNSSSSPLCNLNALSSLVHPVFKVLNRLWDCHGEKNKVREGILSPFIHHTSL